MDFPFDTAGLTSVDIDRFDATYKILKSKFSLELTGEIDFDLQQFEIFKQHQEVNVRDSYSIKRACESSYILFVDAHGQTKDTKRTIHEYDEHQTWALTYLKKDFGRIMLRPETLKDKVLEIMHPIELDFAEDRAFSDTFYVLVNNRPKAIAAIDRNFRNAVMDIRHDDFVIEIVNHALLIGSRKTISPDKAVHLAEFIVRLVSLC